MIGVLLVTHGHVCESLKESMEMILGQQKNFCALSLNPEDDVMELKNRVKVKLQEMDQGEGVIALVDLFGGSPYNTVAACFKEAHMECIAGVNFPMVLGILESREMVSLEKLPEIGVQAGMEGIVNIRQKISSCA